MKNNFLSKTLVLGIIILFFGASIVSNIDVGAEIFDSVSVTNRNENRNFLFRSNPPSEEWNMTFGGTDYDDAYSVQQTSEGGYIITGFTISFGVGNWDVWLIKTDSNGVEEWSYTFGGTSDDLGYCVQQSDDNGYIIAGYSDSYGEGYSDVWLIKTDSVGIEEWNRTFGGSGIPNKVDLGYSVQQTKDDGYIITGDTEIWYVSMSDVVLIKTDSYGNEEWYNTFEEPYSDKGRSVQQTNDEGYILAGWSFSFSITDPDIWLIKTDSSGNEDWNCIFGFGENSGDWGYSVQQTNDNGYIVAGSTMPEGWMNLGSSTSYPAEGTNVWLIKVVGENQPPSTPATPSGPIWLNLNAEGTYNTSASDSDGDQVQYRFDWDAEDSHDYSNWTDLMPSGTIANMHHSWSNGGTYVVKAQARDEYNEFSEWSNGLTVCVNSPPNTPSDPEPENGATNIDINADLSWSCSDPDGDNLTYNVYFEANDPTPDELVSENQTDTTYDPGTMDYDTTYYWQIVAGEEYGLSTEGSVWDFTTGSEPNDPPNPPSNPLPEDDASGVDIEADLSWNCDDPNGDSLTFDVYFDTTSPPMDKVSDDQAETTFDPGTLEVETTYYWQIIAKDEHSAYTAGLVWHFTTEDNYAPDVPIINGPDRGKPGVEYNFTVTATDPEGHDVYYWIEWGDGTVEQDYWIGSYSSGEKVNLSHSWNEKDKFTITAKAKDTFDDESNTTKFIINIPRFKTFNFNINLLSWLFERFPLLEKLLSLIIVR